VTEIVQHGKDVETWPQYYNFFPVCHVLGSVQSNLLHVNIILF